MVEPGGGPPHAVVVHTVPGRTRLRIPDRRHQPQYFRRVFEALSAHPKVAQVRVNPQTGSVLLQHTGTIEEIATDLKPSDLFELRPGDPPARRSVRRPMAGGPNVVSAMALGCVVLGAYQVRRGNLLGSASESAWNAYGAWQNLKAPTVAAALAGGALVQLARGQVLAPAVSLLFYAFNLRKLRQGATDQAG